MKTNPTLVITMIHAFLDKYIYYVVVKKACKKPLKDNTLKNASPVKSLC